MPFFFNVVSTTRKFNGTYAPRASSHKNMKHYKEVTFEGMKLISSSLLGKNNWQNYGRKLIKVLANAVSNSNHFSFCAIKEETLEKIQFKKKKCRGFMSS